MPVKKWQQIIYLIALAFWRAYFDAKIESEIATEELPNEKDLARAQRFRDVVGKLRAQSSNSGPVNTPPTS